MTAPLPDYYKLRTKDVQNLLQVGKNKACQVIQDIKEWLQETKGRQPKDVLFSHFKDYYLV